MKSTYAGSYGPLLACGCELDTAESAHPITGQPGPTWTEVPTCPTCGKHVTEWVTENQIIEIEEVLPAWDGGPLIGTGCITGHRVIGSTTTLGCGHDVPLMTPDGQWTQLSWKVRGEAVHTRDHSAIADDQKPLETP